MRITLAGSERLPELEPLWAAMQHHHETVVALRDVVAFREPAASWEVRHGLYRLWMADADTRLHVAETADGALAGYAMVVMNGGWSQLDTPPRVAELASLSVAQKHRGQGIGTRLLAAVHADLREREIGLMSVVVFAGNVQAQRLYEAHGMRAMSTHMLGRVPPG